MRPEVVRALDGVSLAVDEGEVVGLVGGAGWRKSTVGRIIAGIMPPSEGVVRFRGEGVAELASRDGRAGRAGRLGVQMIFQDPMASLNPRMRVRDIVGEAPLVHGLVARADLD